MATSMGHAELSEPVRNLLHRPATVVSCARCTPLGHRLKMLRAIRDLGNAPVAVTASGDRAKLGKTTPSIGS